MVPADFDLDDVYRAEPPCRAVASRTLADRSQHIPTGTCEAIQANCAKPATGTK